MALVHPVAAHSLRQPIGQKADAQKDGGIMSYLPRDACRERVGFQALFVWRVNADATEED